MSGELGDAAWQAAAKFGLEPTGISLLSHSENAVFDLAFVDGSHLALRLHRPGYNTIEQMRSEVHWVRSLAAAGLGVPEPVATPTGEFYVPVDVGDGSRLAGVISWVQGESVGAPLGDDELPDPGLFRRVGEIAASIRVHNATWKAPAGFTRRHWDADGLAGPDPLWGRFWDIPELTPAQRTLFGEIRERLHAELAALSTGPERYGLIHADLHLGNLMAHGEELTVIDFDDSGYGWYAHELAVALHSASDEPGFDAARAAMLAGYRSVHPLEHDEEALIDTFLAVRSMMIVAWLHHRPEVPAYVHLPAVIADAEVHAREFLNRSP